MPPVEARPPPLLFLERPEVEPELPVVAPVTGSIKEARFEGKDADVERLLRRSWWRKLDNFRIHLFVCIRDLG